MLKNSATPQHGHTLRGQDRTAKLAPQGYHNGCAVSTRTIREHIVDLANGLAWCWIASWLPRDPMSVITQTPAKTRDAKDLDVTLPPGANAVGWSGLTRSGTAAWVGWDLDVGHGRKCYSTTDAALDAAHQIRDALSGCAEIRMSKSGRGVHVRHWCAPARLANEKAIDFSKRLVQRLNIQADPTPLGRQAFWFWCADPGAASFQLIAEDAQLEKHLAYLREGGAV